MSKQLKISIIVISIVAVLIAIGAVLAIYADKIAKRIVTEQAVKVLTEKGLPVSWSDFDIKLIQGSVSIDSLTFDIKAPDSTAVAAPYFSLLIKQVYMGRIHWRKLFKHQILEIDNIDISNPVCSTCSPKEAFEKFKNQMSGISSQDSTDSLSVGNKKIILKLIEIGSVNIIDGCFSMSKLTDKLKLMADSFSVSVFDIACNFADSALAYNDSLYTVSLNKLDFLTGNGLMHVMSDRIETINAGKLTIDNLRCENTDKKEQHSKNVGKKPASWIKFDTKQISTSPVNIIRMARAKEVVLDTLSIEGNKFFFYRDNQYKPQQPYAMPQEGIAKIKIPLNIKHTNVAFNHFLMNVTLDGNRIGELTLKKTNIGIKDITNLSGSIIRANISTNIADGGKLVSDLDLTLNKKCDFRFKSTVSDTYGKAFSPFLEPLFGVKVGCNIHKIDMDCKGDNIESTGTYCMQYDSLDIQINKETTPIEKLGKYAGLINTFAPAVLQKKNPRHKGEQPQSYEVSKTRDEWKPFPVYLIGPMIDGMLKSVLPPIVSKSRDKSRESRDKSRETKDKSRESKDKK